MDRQLGNERQVAQLDQVIRDLEIAVVLGDTTQAIRSRFELDVDMLSATQQLWQKRVKCPTELELGSLQAEIRDPHEDRIALRALFDRSR